MTDEEVLDIAYAATAAPRERALAAEVVRLRATRVLSAAVLRRWDAIEDARPPDRYRLVVDTELDYTMHSLRQAIPVSYEPAPSVRPMSDIGHLRRRLAQAIAGSDGLAVARLRDLAARACTVWFDAAAEGPAAVTEGQFMEAMRVLAEVVL